MAASIKPELRDYIAGIAEIVSAGYSVFVDRIPEDADAQKSIVIGRSSTDYHPTLDEDDDALVTEAFGIEVRGKNSEAAFLIQKEMVDELRHLQGYDLGDERRTGAIFIDDVMDSFEMDDYGNDTGKGVVVVTIRVMHTPQGV